MESTMRLQAVGSTEDECAKDVSQVVETEEFQKRYSAVLEQFGRLYI
jgi:uncharacterized protein YutD